MKDEKDKKEKHNVPKVTHEPEKEEGENPNPSEPTDE